MSLPDASTISDMDSLRRAVRSMMEQTLENYHVRLRQVEDMPEGASKDALREHIQQGLAEARSHIAAWK